MSDRTNFATSGDHRTTLHRVRKQ